jgi:hypothetical protein
VVDRLDLSRTPPPPDPLLSRGGELFSWQRSISPYYLSAEKSRARFFAPLRCAQNDSVADLYIKMTH